MNNEVSPQNRIWYVLQRTTQHLQLSVSTSEYSVLGTVIAGDPALDRTGIPGRALNYRSKIAPTRSLVQCAIDGAHA